MKGKPEILQFTYTRLYYCNAATNERHWRAVPRRNPPSGAKSQELFFETAGKVQINAERRVYANVLHEIVPRVANCVCVPLALEKLGSEKACVSCCNCYLACHTVPFSETWYHVPDT